jgi:O-antigen/teichoic acid export membrane protein
MLAALLSMPVLLHAIGDSRFGMLSIAWMLIGYFGLFDFGIGRAMTHGVSQRLAHDRSADISDLVWTGLSALAGIGTTVGVALAVASRWLVFAFINIQHDLRPEAASSLLILAAAVPLVTVSAGQRGKLEDHQQFKAINLVMMPLGALLFAAPVVAIQFSVALPAIMLSLLLARFCILAVLLLLCARTVHRFRIVRVSGSTLRDLLGFGGWMTVSNVVSPIMVNMDRVVVGSLLSISAVTYYVTPYEMISKLAIVPGSIANASFPEFSRLHKIGSVEATRRYFVKTVLLLLVILAPAAMLASIAGHELLRWWISQDLADRSTVIFRILAFGVVLNGLAYVPFAYVQGIGRSDVTAKFHLIELALYVPTLYLMIRGFGLRGVAMAWVFRVLVDAALLFAYSYSQLKRRVDGSFADLNDDGAPRTEVHLLVEGGA